MQELSLREIQKESLKVLKLVDYICRQENLTYCLFYGTLIGAIRHNGFIPWDDDIDIVMPRNDYDKLKRYFIDNKDNLKPFVFFDPATNEQYPYMLARICNTDFKIDTYNEYNSGMGIFIDIYPLDVVSRNILKRFIISFKARFLTTLYVLKSKKHLVKKRNFFYTVSQYFLYFFSFFYSKKSIYKKQMQLVNISKNDHSDIVSCIVWSGGVFKYFYNKSDIETLIDWNFEDGSFKIPKNYDKILRSDYGNYMQLPPEKDRIPHHFYKVYRKEDL